MQKKFIPLLLFSNYPDSLDGNVIPAQAGIQVVNLTFKNMLKAWIPAFAGMTTWGAPLFLMFSQIGLAIAASDSPRSLQGSNLLNPNISAIGWFQGEAGHRHLSPNTEKPEAFQLKEVELALQAVVDPYARADFFIGVHSDGADLEEGYLTWFNLPCDVALKIGKFKANFGRFNRVHAGETAFADRPLAEEKYFGEEGLSGSGASLSWHIPNPFFFANLDLEALTSPAGDEVPGFDKANKGNLLYVGRLSNFLDLTESSNLSLGVSYAHGPAGQEFNVLDNSSTTLASQFYGFDMIYRWKNPRQAIYRSFSWQNEIFWNNREVTTVHDEKSRGYFSHIDYQFARRWRTGVRYDYTQTPTDNTLKEKGGLAYITFSPSEFSQISLQGRNVQKEDGTHETIGFVKTTFNIGPHGAHPF